MFPSFLTCLFLAFSPFSQFILKFLQGSCDTKFEFKAASDEECDKWVSTIKSHIEASEGHAKQSLAPQTSTFWQ